MLQSHCHIATLPSRLYPLNPIFRALRRLWDVNFLAQPLLALSVALARDPLLRGTQPFYLSKQPGEAVSRESVEAVLAGAHPDRFSPASLRSFAQNINGANCLFLEPAWKALLSNKGLLPVLWQMFEGHPNLLPAFFEADIGGGMGGTGPIAGDVSAAFSRAEAALTAGHVRKPILSREGASVSILKNGEIVEQAQNTEYSEHPRIVQAYAPLPQFDGFRPVIGAWVVGEACVGVGIREDRSRITQDLSRFKPHFITA